MLTKKTIRLLIATIVVIGLVETISRIFHQTGYEGRQLVFYLWCLALVIVVGFWGFRSHKEWVKNITLSFVAVALLLLVIDFVFFVIIVAQSPRKMAKAYPPASSYVKPDKDLGYVPYADTTFNPILKYDTTTIYNIHFSTDKYSHRYNPFDPVKHGSKYAMFFGCSITFGEGVNDSETIPARFSEYVPEYHSYNFGYSGYGTQQMLANLQKPDIKNEITENSGIGFYIFINAHINRAIGDMQTYDAWGADMPYYYLNNDSLIRKGSFKTGRWFTSAIYTLLGRSSFLKYFKVNFPAHITNYHYKLVSAMIEESYNQYVSKFGNQNFYVIIFPGEKLDIVPYLKAKHIKVLDYSKLFDRNSPANSFQPYDPHPRPDADKIFAQHLSEDIKKIVP